ncbi:uncharacterized protein LOC134201760 [Bombyx mori]|uniref:uncharacterized protein LOC134201760 n=1 Tax=Bombyx mori TaxID=7091 RepID=UPI002ED5F76B
MTLSQNVKCNFTRVSTDNPDTNSIIDIQNQLACFWQLEEISPHSEYSKEEQECEEHFKEHTSRLTDGRFCVKIPLKLSPDILGESLPRAKRCLQSLEHRLKGKPAMNVMYKDFMREYEFLGHMAKCPILDYNKAHFIPHHGVLRESSTTSKLRVVSNASSPTTSGVCFNNIQMVGPVVQDDLLSILLRFRQHTYVLTADVEKMYSQISVHPDDRYLQRIIWRDDPAAPVQAYELNTVTYGTATAPYLATRCLRQLGLECSNERVSEVILHDFFVDDLLTGGDDLSEVQDLRQKVSAVLASAQMVLRKWKSNKSTLMNASENAYGACLYVRSVDQSDEVTVRLLMAKSRVAPLKPTTIPRLKLCAALVGTRLYEKTFVRNRIAEIQDKTASCEWRHVPTTQNPADHLSRGVTATVLSDLDQWWSGPAFLKKSPSSWPGNTMLSYFMQALNYFSLPSVKVIGQLEVVI